ncbi:MULTISPECIES: hypothetical protein [Burkholderia]|uniref:hypothetical protein n=1 Tax=Burkholderia TaxID=32008 RepID=UPI0012E34510|nr:MULTISPECIES: hypothetical protein [Burkholderia]
MSHKVSPVVGCNRPLTVDEWRCAIQASIIAARKKSNRSASSIKVIDGLFHQSKPMVRLI